MPRDFLIEQFHRAGMTPLDIHVLRYSEESFGDFSAEVKTTVGLLRVERERGQSFVDYFDATKGAFIRGDVQWPQLLPTFKKGTWELSDLLRTIVASS